MEDKNESIYQAPDSDLMTGVSGNQGQIASLGKRFLAALVDTIIMVIIIIPLTLFIVGAATFDPNQESTLMFELLMGLVGIGIYLAVNYRLIVRQGQTIGKKVVGIRIVNERGEVPELNPSLLKRYAVYMLPGLVPLIGFLFSIVNILWIFGSERRCIHDLVANTWVVEV